MAYLLQADKLTAWLRAVAGEAPVYGPVRDGQGQVIWGRLAEAEEAVLEPGVVSDSAKRVFYPPSEEMLRYSYHPGCVRLLDEAPEPQPLVLFGVRPCDALALQQTDHFWAADQGDPYYENRREQSVVIAVNCTAVVPECFCEGISGAMSQPRGMDLLLTPLPAGGYLVESFSDRGAARLEQTAELLQPASADDEAVRPALAERLRTEQTRRIEREGLQQRLQAVFKDREFWLRFTQACIGCGVCTFECPTCTCFDVLDDAVMGHGYRYRCWDSCQFRHFCEEASGHDRRPFQWERQRQRVCHKLWYSVERFDEITCVGCGRCIRLCPVNIDIAEIAQGTLAAQAQTAAN